MAKIVLEPHENIDTVAEQLAVVGVTVDKHPLGNNTYRVYVRKENKEKFLAFGNEIAKTKPLR